eukprot:12311614-Heterocapsa_arctica.AAC.1
MQQVRKALRGDDKTLLFYNKFLARGKGDPSADGHLLEDVIHTTDFWQFKNLAIAGLAAAYLLKAWGHMLLGELDAPARHIQGDFILFDASRVSSKEVLLVHVFSHG